MDFKTKQRLKNGLTALGLIGLGYFIGRPDQLHRMARGLEDHLIGSQARYVVPIRVRAASLQFQAVAPQAQGWNLFSDPGGHFSVMVPPAPVEEKRESSTGKTFLIEAGGEYYRFGYVEDIPNIRLFSEQGKRVILEEAADSFKGDFNVVSRRSFGLNGNPGVEFYLQHKSKNLPRMVMRKILVGDRLYFMGVATNYPQNAETFLNSFRPH
ncbi:hypothetical protein QUB68_28305 [Microcoleus sp. A006_D1]|uniref:hypothetical protein n=1 Tax=Microcoleus sp. A006_D1 TaxID=3055267 RepID=UPI002FD51543